MFFLKRTIYTTLENSCHEIILISNFIVFKVHKYVGNFLWVMFLKSVKKIMANLFS